ncbi:peptidylprolyl isomerase [Acidilutibacter cellobiosedens]|uniref:Foldase protein PrsA n=1 Tax=Acidilutibacter cellobiosedens TaxID=2507161 RepID=A0A410QG01_9FIRM|nr:peptidylprolyl isomerase [Acidilutibacter cellobiosedens]MBE6082225.1 peptidylprolyl isomerase [Tissierellaceae bacterium]QAT62768.1 peptidylprolyl isomerase [Acidilutibacter cellobiosedens]
MFSLVNMKRRILIIFLAVIMILASFAGCEKLNKNSVATVDGDNISKEEFNKNFNMYKKAYESQYGSDIMSTVVSGDKTFEEVLKEKTLDLLISEKLIVGRANEKKIAVSEKDITDQINSYKEELGGEEKYTQFLKDNDMTEEYFKDNIKKELLIQKYKDDYINNLKISNEDAKKYFEENKDSFIKIRASHILLKTEDEAKKVEERLKKGEKFNDLAYELSIDKVSAAKGGDLGYFTKGQMVEEFDNAAFALKVGEVSGIVKTDYGFHIIKVDDKVDQYDKLKEDVIASLKEKKYNEYLTKLRDEADVKIYLDTATSTKTNNNEEKK